MIIPLLWDGMGGGERFYTIIIRLLVIIAVVTIGGGDPYASQNHYGNNYLLYNFLVGHAAHTKTCQN